MHRGHWLLLLLYGGTTTFSKKHTPCPVDHPNIICQDGLTRFAPDVYSEPFPGVYRRCDKVRDCRQTMPRVEQFSLSFLCCEAGGYVAIHILTPMALYVFTHDLFSSLLAPFWWELVEAYVITRKLARISTETPSSTDTETNILVSDGAFETVTGLLFGDAFLGGGTGVLLGITLVSALQSPRLFPHWAEVRARRKKWVWFKYLLLLAIVASVSTPVFALPRAKDEQRQSVMIALANIAVLLLFFPLATMWRVDEEFIWRRRYPPPKRFLFLLVWCAIIASIYASAALGLEFLPNDYFQAWLVAALWILVLTIVGCARCAWAASPKNPARIGGGSRLSPADEERLFHRPDTSFQKDLTNLAHRTIVKLTNKD